MRPGNPASTRQSGFTYVWMLATVAILGVGLAALGELWSAAVQREREDELIRVGVAYANAIASYHRMSPGSVRQFPTSLEALLLDDRYPMPQRHLRRLYPDPTDPQRALGLVRDGSDRIRAVYSLSAGQPWRRVESVVGGVTLPAASSYSEWKFGVKELQ